MRSAVGNRQCYIVWIARGILYTMESETGNKGGGEQSTERRKRRGDDLLAGGVGHLASDDLDLVHVEDLGIVELERCVAYAEGPHFFA